MTEKFSLSRCYSLFFLALMIVFLSLGLHLSPRAGAEEASDGYVLEASALKAFAAETKADGEKTEVGGFFTLLWSAKARVDSSTKTWEDGYTSSQRVSFGGKATRSKNSVRFTVVGPATVKLWWVQAGDDNRQMVILNSEGDIAAQTDGEYERNQPYYSELRLDKGGTYYLGGRPDKNYIFKVEVVPDPSPGSYVLTAYAVDAFPEGTKKDGQTTQVGDFFTLLWSAETEVDSSAKIWEDGYQSAQRFNFGGKAATEKDAVRFTTSGPATVKIWWVQAGDDHRQMAILNSQGAVAAQTYGVYERNCPYYSELTLAEAGTYYLGGLTNKNYLFKVEVVPDPAYRYACLEFFAREDGALTVQAGDETPLFDGPVSTNEKISVTVPITVGENTVTFVFTPVADFGGSPNEKASAINPASVVYVSPDGLGDGTKDNPESIFRAVKEAEPGQQIIMAGGTYLMKGKLDIERGINGTEENPITLMADPDDPNRPVLDFCGNSAGVVLGGDYWRLIGFDVTNTRDTERGIQVSGHHNVLERLETYRNGNTGIQISRYKGTDAQEDWPSHNLVLNCTSYLNADPDGDDADGFAAKLTCGEGNVFDGCIAYYNADDGFDLYAKEETGTIGQVVIRNCVAYKNGFLRDDEGHEISAGDGNGFKLGGSALPGGHMLVNSIAFANKCRGIDSNSCPDVQVFRSTSFANGLYNVELYTTTAENTDFYVDGLLSFNLTKMKQDTLNLKGTQDSARVYAANNFYIIGSQTVNSEGVRAQENWFVSLDTEAAVNGGVTRNEDGSINMNGFLELTDAAPAGTGARISGEPVQ